MLRRWSSVLCCLALAAPAMAASPAFPRTVRDARGTAVILAAPPRRIVSLTPSVTEMLFALGLGGRVVGDTVYCNYPSAAQKIAKIGDVNTNYEKVLALRPDLIVGSDANTSAAARLNALRQPVFVVTPTSWVTTEQSLTLLGRLTGTEAKAQAVVAGMEGKRRTAAALAARDARHPRVLYVVGLNPLWTAGTGTFIDDVLTRAGGVNVASGLRGYAPLSKETLLAHPPDVILAGPKDAAAMRADPVLSRLPAVRGGHFFAIHPDLISRPGPRLADALLLVSRALHPGGR